MSTVTDPRPLYRDALAWVDTLFAQVRPEQMTDPTPCPQFDVRALLGHLVATVDRGRVIGSGGDPLSIPEFLTGVPDDAWRAELERRRPTTGRCGATTTCSTGPSSRRGERYPDAPRC